MFVFIIFLWSVHLISPQPAPKLLVGYWHNFINGAGFIRLNQISQDWDVINVSFGETLPDQCTITFSPMYSENDFINDIKYLQSKGKKVLLSIGGQNGAVSVSDSSKKETFISSLKAVLNKYNFDGLDVDLEHGIVLGPGDNDFQNPKSPQLVNLISQLEVLSLLGNQDST